MKNIGHTYISLQHIKDIQALFAVVAIAALILFSINLLAEDKATTERIVPAKPSANTIPTTDFAKLDINRDGKLSRDEASRDAVLTSGFDVVDTDVNGTLDSNEYSVYIITTAPN